MSGISSENNVRVDTYTHPYIYIYIYILLSIFGVDAGVMFTMKIDDFEGGAQVTKPKLLNARE